MLNGFWNEISKEAESLWSWVKLFAELDNHSKVPRGAKGSELDQVLAAKFLEQTEQTLTAKQRKEALREIDVNNDGKMALVEYLLYRFGMTADQVANAKQGKCFNLFKEYARKEKRTPPATLFNLSHADICVHSHYTTVFAASFSNWHQQKATPKSWRHVKPSSTKQWQCSQRCRPTW